MYPTYLQKLKSLQNRAARAVAGAYFLKSVNPFYSQLKVLQTDNLFKFEVTKFVYGALNSNLFLCCGPVKNGKLFNRPAFKNTNV